MKKRSKKLLLLRVNAASRLSRCAVIAMTSVLSYFIFGTGAKANSAAFPCKVEFFFDKGSAAMLSTMRLQKKDFDLQEQAAQQFRQLDHFRSVSTFYVIGTVGGQEDVSPNHKIATARALAVQGWLQRRGVPAEKIFAYAEVPAGQTPYGNGDAEALFCNTVCPCRNGFDQRARVFDPYGIAPEYPVHPN